MQIPCRYNCIYFRLDPSVIVEIMSNFMWLAYNVLKYLLEDKGGCVSMSYL